MRTDTLGEELRVTVDAGVELTNDLDIGGGGVRGVLIEHEFSRAGRASDDEIDEVGRRFEPVAVILRSLPDTELADAVVAVNRELAGCHVAPNVVAHDHFPLHIHWTSVEATFGHQVVVDVLMAVAQTLCEDGIDRFGRCGADGCDRLFYDATKNRSRRFCSDPRCASRTHTAEHRARQRDG